MSDAEFRSSRPDEAEEIIHLVVSVFKGSEEHYRALLHGDPLLDYEHLRVAVVEGRIVSTVWILPRPVRWCGGSITLGGIGNVVTHPEYRGRGYAAQLMGEATAFMKERGYPLALLRTEIPAYYAKLGWEILPTSEWRIPVDTELPTADHKCRVRPFDRSRDLEAVMDIYAKINERNNGSVIRSRPYWEAHFSWIGYEIQEDPDAFLVAEDEHGVIGYVRATKKGRVAEAACNCGDKTYWSLLDALLWYGRQQAWEAVILPSECFGLDFLRYYCQESKRMFQEPKRKRLNSIRFFELMIQLVDPQFFMEASRCNPPEVGWRDLIREKGFHYWMTDYF